MRLRLPSLSAWLLCALCACQPDPPVPSKEALALRDAPAQRLFRGPLGGATVELLAHDCKVFVVSRGPDQAVSLREVLAPPPYPFFTVCDRQSLQAEDGAVVATLGRMAFGAGGCCATGGTWRSTDGEQWQPQ